MPYFYGMLKDLSCLLIDDDDDDQEIFALAVQDIPDRIHCNYASDGLEALELLQDPKNIPHVIFLDMNMPRMNGIQCLAAIRKMERLKDVPVYIYSTSKDPYTVEAAMHLGAESYLVKPADVPTLTSLLTEVFSDTRYRIQKQRSA